MNRDIRLVPKSTVSGWSSMVDPNTSPYYWLGTGSMSVDAIWRQNAETATTPLAGNLDGTAGSQPYAYGWAGVASEHVVAFEPGPTLATFLAVRIRTRFDYCQTGPNNWLGSGGSPSLGPGVTLKIRNRAKSGYLSGPSVQIGDPASLVGDLSDWDAFNSRPSKGWAWQLTPWIEWLLTSHPEGGPFTLEDINALAAGVSFLSYGFDNSQGSFSKIRVPNFTVTVTVQDLGGYVRSVRHNASAAERLERKARNTVVMKVPAFDATKEIGETVNFASDQGGAEGEGWGSAALERGSGFLVQRTYWPEALRVDDECYDLHDFSCELWGAFRIPIAWTPELSGICYLDQGGEFTMARDQDSWSLRPGDGAAVRVLKNYLNLCEDGLALHSSNGVELALYNANLGSAGWSSATTGGASFSAETAQPMADELGYSDSIGLTFSGTPGTASKSRPFSLASGDTLSVRARVRNVSVDDPDTKFLEVQVVAPSGKSWDEATRSWTVGASYNPIPSDAGFGEAVFDQIPISETGSFTIKVGRMSSAINTASFVVALVSCQQNAHGCGMPLVTLGSTLARVADVVTFDNSGSFAFWHRGRGCLTFEFRPFWRADALVALTEKPLLRANHSGGAFDEVRLVAGATDSFVYERNDSVGSRTVSVEILDANNAPFKLSRSHYVRVFVRWLDASGWRKHAPHEVMIAYAIHALDGSFVAYHENALTLSPADSETEDEVVLQGLDGWLRWVEVKHNPISPTEAVWRR